MYAVASSGGKDSTFALYHAQNIGFPVTHLFHVYNKDTSRTRFHGYKPSMVAQQAECMGLRSIIVPTSSSEFDNDFNIALGKVKQEGLKGLIFGNLFLEDIREFYKTRVKAMGLEYYDALWKRDTRLLLEEFIIKDFRAVITSVWVDKLDRKYLGRELDEGFLLDILKEKDVDPCGENGEYHTLAFDGPCFREPLQYKIHGEHEERNVLEGKEYLNVFLDIREC